MVGRAILVRSFGRLGFRYGARWLFEGWRWVSLMRRCPATRRGHSWRYPSSDALTSRKALQRSVEISRDSFGLGLRDGEVPPGRLALCEDSFRAVMIAVNLGSAARSLRVGRGDPVVVSRVAQPASRPVRPSTTPSTIGV